MNWKDNFEQKILSRGLELKDKVKNYKREIFKVSGTIKGTETYQVSFDSIDVTNENFYSCNCPYYESGKNCKHVAALLYKYDEKRLESLDDSESKKGKLGDKLVELTEKVKSMEMEDLTDFIEFMLDRKIINDGLMEEFENYKKQKEAEELSQMQDSDGELRMVPYKGKINGVDMFSDSENKKLLKTLISEFRSIIRHHSKSGFIDYFHGYDFVIDAVDFIESTYKNHVLKYGNVKLGWELAKKLISIIDKIDMDGSNGEHSDLLECVRVNLIKTLNVSDLDNRKNILLDLVILYEGKDDYNFADTFIRDFIIDDFREASLKVVQYDFISMLLNNMKQGNYLMDCINLSRIKLKRDYHDDIERDLDGITNSEEGLKFYYDFMITEKREKELIDKLKELKSEAENKEKEGKYHIKSPTENISVMLKNIYLMQGDKDNFKKEIKYLTDKVNYFNFDDFLNYKRFSDDKEWEEFKKTMGDIRYSDKVIKFLYEEKLFDRIVKFSLDTIRRERRVFNKIKEEIPDRIRDLIIKEVKGELSEVGTRKTYRDVSFKVAELYSIEGGKEVADSLIDELILKYPRRQAMKEELLEVKYSSGKRNQIRYY